MKHRKQISALGKRIKLLSEAGLKVTKRSPRTDSQHDQHSRARAGDRELRDAWPLESDPIKGKGNASAEGTLVECTSGYLMLMKMNDATTNSAAEGFSSALNRHTDGGVQEHDL